MTYQDSPPPTSSAAPATFEWGQVMRETGMRGLAALLARHVQLVEYDPAAPRLEIEIHDQLAPIAEAGALDILHEHLRQFFGDGLLLSVTYGEAPKSLAIQAQDKRVSDMEQTMKSFVDDPFVAEMAQTFGSKVYVDSITADPLSP